jgi:diguanylate cyclase (GGDEF)-like protein
MSGGPERQLEGVIPLLELCDDGIALVNVENWRVLYANGRLAEWFHRPADKLCDLQLQELLAPASHENALAIAHQVLDGSMAVRKGTVQFALSGSKLDEGPTVVMRACRVVTREAEVLGLVFHREIDALPLEESSLRHDPLTGLLDRQFLMTRLETLTSHRSTNSKNSVVLFIDLDDFKQVNDAHGHLVGDRVLQEVARRLNACAGPSDHVVRYGGDEFVILMENATQGSDTRAIIECIHAAFAEAIALPEGKFTLSLSIGAAERADYFISAEQWLAAADQAMFTAKRE